MNENIGNLSKEIETRKKKQKYARNFKNNWNKSFSGWA